MDNIFDRAHDMIDKAQGKVASAASQAAWAANQGLLIRNLEGQLQALHDEIERVTREIGERAYAAWKGRVEDPRVAALCGHLDDLYGQRHRVSADLSAVRAATYDPRSYQPMPPAPQLSSGARQPRPSLVPPRPIPSITPHQQPPAPVIVDARAQPAPPPPSPPPAQDIPVAPRPSTPAAAQASAPIPAPEPQARECPNCGHFVPGGADYCPMCGIRVV